MKHFCGGQIIYRREEQLWYCQNCNTIHYALADFVSDNRAEEHYKEVE